MSFAIRQSLEAHPAINSSGRLLSKGKKTTRLCISSEGKTIAEIAIRPLPKSFLEKIELRFLMLFQRTVTFRLEGKKYFMSLGSLKARVGVTKDEVRRAKKEGVLLFHVAEKAALHADAVNVFNQLVEEKNHAKVSSLRRISKKALMEISHLYISGHISAPAFYEKRKVILLPRERTLELAFFQKKLSKGGMGELSAYRTFNGSRYAFKTPRKGDAEKRKRCIESIKNEITQLSQIHINGPVKGIQAPLESVYSISHHHGKKEFLGAIGECYEGDYYTLIKSKKERSDLLQEASLLISSLTFLHENHIVHGDIKPQNIFYNRDGSLFLADFGGAFSTHDKSSPRKITTTSYSSHEDVEVEDKDQEQFLFSKDIFSLGVTLYLRCMGEFPFPFVEVNGKRYLDSSAPLPSFSPDIPEVLQKTILEMLNKDYRRRHL